MFRCVDGSRGPAPLTPPRGATAGLSCRHHSQMGFLGATGRQRGEAWATKYQVFR